MIARAGKPLVRLVPLAIQPAPRRGGFLRGQVVITADRTLLGYGDGVHWVGWLRSVEGNNQGQQ